MNMTAFETLAPTPIRSIRRSAVAWINGSDAKVAMIDRDGWISTCEITRGSLPEAPYLANVVRVIGDRQRVVILGPGSVRLAFEREYVEIFKRPDRLVDVEPEGAVDMPSLVRRVRALGA
jgi:hypothetical protein